MRRIGDLLLERDNLDRIEIDAPTDAALKVLNDHREELAHLETQHGVKIAVLPNAHLHSPHFHLRVYTEDKVETFEEGYTADPTAPKKDRRRGRRGGRSEDRDKDRSRDDEEGGSRRGRRGRGRGSRGEGEDDGDSRTSDDIEDRTDGEDGEGEGGSAASAVSVVVVGAVSETAMARRVLRRTPAAMTAATRPIVRKLRPVKTAISPSVAGASAVVATAVSREATTRRATTQRR